MTCPHKNPDFARYCATCGELLERVQCRCGISNLVTNEYCHGCGHHLHIVEVTEATSNMLYGANKKPILKTLLASISGEIKATQGSSESVSQSDIDSLFGK